MCLPFETWGPSAISIVGFGITIWQFRSQLRSVKQEKVTDKQRELYIDVYNTIENVVKDNSLVFRSEYYNDVSSYQGKMKLIAASNTLKLYKEFLKFIYDIQHAHRQFCIQNDPREKTENWVTVFAGDPEKENEVCCVTENDIDQYESSLREYEIKNCPENSAIKKKVSNLLNSMRADLNVDKIKEDKG